MPVLLGVGIDLVNLPRIREFIQRHGAKVQRLLHPNEKKIFHGKISPRTLARIFAAKEAYFKALDRPWLGLDGLAGMEIRPISRDRFTIHESILEVKKQRTVLGAFFESRSLVGAQVLLFSAGLS